MANFLQLNGIAVPCSADAGGDNDVEQVGESKRAVDGTMRIHRRVVKRKWGYQTTPQEFLAAVAFRGLVLGLGHYWSFDDTTKGLYSSKGLGPTGAITGVTLGTSSPTPILGTGRLQITATNKIDYTLGGPLVGMSVAVWQNINQAGWNHFLKDDLGNVWTNGVLTGSAAFIAITLSTGLARVSADATFTTCFDELIVLPYRVPTDWPNQIYTAQLGGAQPGSLAQLKATGDGIDGNLGTVIVKGEASGLSIMPGTKTAANGFKPNLHKMHFTLDEI